MSQKHQILRQKDSRWCQISWNRWYFEARHSYALWWFAVTPKEIKDDKSHLPPFTTSISVSHIYQLCPRWGQTNQLHASDRNPRVTARAALVWCAPAQHPTWHWRSPYQISIDFPGLGLSKNAKPSRIMGISWALHHGAFRSMSKINGKMRVWRSIKTSAASRRSDQLMILNTYTSSLQGVQDSSRMIVETHTFLDHQLIPWYNLPLRGAMGAMKPLRCVVRRATQWPCWGLAAGGSEKALPLQHVLLNVNLVLNSNMGLKMVDPHIQWCIIDFPMNMAIWGYTPFSDKPVWIQVAAMYHDVFWSRWRSQILSNWGMPTIVNCKSAGLKSPQHCSAPWRALGFENLRSTPITNLKPGIAKAWTIRSCFPESNSHFSAFQILFSVKDQHTCL